MKKTTNRQARRDLLNILSIAGVVISARTLPEKWVRPAVDSVLLPSHAQLSPPPPNFCNVDLETASIPSFFPFIVSGTTITLSGTSTGTLIGNTFTITDTLSVGTCLDGSTRTTNFTVTGTINLGTTPDSITATLTGEELCGGVPTCTQSANITCDKTAGAEGVTDGTYVNAEPILLIRTCCPERLDPNPN